MTNLFSIPENVMIQHLLPRLDHNDVVRLRRVCKQTKILADTYLWTSQPGNQGKWELKIDCREEDQTLQAFLQLGLPPPSRLYIVNRAENGPSEPGTFFEDEQLETFMERYGKYVTKLALDKLFIPFTSAKELGFYESLINLKKLRCGELVTVGGAAQFENKTTNAEGGFLIRPTFKKLAILKLGNTDCLDSMWNFINGVSNNLEQLLHPFQRINVDEPGNVGVLNRVNLAPVRELIERRGMNSQSKLVYDWTYLRRTNHLELLRVFASCRDNGVIIKNLAARYLDCLLCDENGRIADRYEVVDPIAREWIQNPAVNYQRNLFVGNVIQSLMGATDNVFLMEMPALEEIRIGLEDNFQIYRRHGVGYPQWPNLRKMYIRFGFLSGRYSRFFLGNVLRPNLEELSLVYRWYMPFPLDLGNCCGNLKRLTVDCLGGNLFFLSLWDGLPLLEDLTVSRCVNLTDRGFVGNEVDGRGPVFLKLEKLKRLNILFLDDMPRITNAVFRKVFRHLKLSSLKLSSDLAINSITVAGINELLTGPFAESIEKLDLDQLRLRGVSEEELKEVVSSFRSSKMI